MDGHYGNSLYNHGLPPNAKTFDCGNNSGNAGLTAARSRHAGGVQILKCDGSVGFVGDSVNLGTWQALATKSGNEVTGDY